MWHILCLTQPPRYSDYLHGIMLEGCQALAAAAPGRHPQLRPQNGTASRQQGQGQRQPNPGQQPAKQQQGVKSAGGKRRERGGGGGGPPKNSKAAQQAAQQAAAEAAWRTLRVGVTPAFFRHRDQV